MLDRYSPEFYNNSFLSTNEIREKRLPTDESFLPLKEMNLQQLKSQASLDQKLLIEKVENLVRSEYDLVNLKKEIHSELKDKIFKEVYKVLERYGIVNVPNSNFKNYSMSEVYYIRDLCYKIGEAVRLECENDKEIKSSDIL